MKHTCSNCGHVEDVKSSKKRKADPVATDIVKFYWDAFKEEFNEPPTARWVACETIARELLTVKSSQELKELLVKFIKTKDDFYEKSGYHFGVFPNFIQKQAVKSKHAWDGML